MTNFIKTKYNQTIAYNKFDGKKTGIIFFSGFKSDMTGQKAIEIEKWAKKNDHSYLRFDYTGHGKSSGKFEKLVFSNWLEDSEFMIKNFTSGPQVLIGSSMGGWIILNLIKKNNFNIKSIIGLAPAPDFPKRLIWDKLSYSQKKELVSTKKLILPSDFEEDYIITSDLVKDSYKNFVMNNKINFEGNVFLYHGMKDVSVPYQESLLIAEKIQNAKNVKLILEKNGEHRLSEDNEIFTILKLIELSI